MIQSLLRDGGLDFVSPLASFHQLADFAFNQVTLERADVADIELAIEVIGLVQESAGEQILAGLLVELASHVLGTDGDFARARYSLAKFRHAEATLILALTAFSVNDLWIGEHKFCFRIFLKGDVNDGQALGEPDLRSCESDAMSTSRLI